MEIKVVEQTKTLMDELESKGIIRCLRPGGYKLPIQEGKSDYTTIYSSDDQFGPHKLIAVTIGTTDLSDMSYHSDNEEFICIGHPGLIMVVSPLECDEFKEKNDKGLLNVDDFIAFRIKMNDPDFCFFVMNKGYPHTELTEKNKQATFYVTESRDIDDHKIVLNKKIGVNYEAI